MRGIREACNFYMPPVSAYVKELKPGFYLPAIWMWLNLSVKSAIG